VRVGRSRVVAEPQFVRQSRIEAGDRRGFVIALLGFAEAFRRRFARLVGGGEIGAAVERIVRRRLQVRGVAGAGTQARGALFDRRIEQIRKRIGRRRRGGPEDGLVGSISDELAPLEASEAQEAVADFDGFTTDSQNPQAPVEPAPALPDTLVAEQPVHEPVAAAVAQPAVEPQMVPEADKPARRSTVREKVSFAANPASETAAAVAPHAPEPAPASAEPAPAETDQAGPRKAGWWSRRFGGGE